MSEEKGMSQDQWDNLSRRKRISVLMRDPSWWLLIPLVTISLIAERFSKWIIPFRDRLSRKVINSGMKRYIEGSH